MEHQELGPDVIRVALRGRLDSKAVDQMETELTALLVGSRRHAVVDLQGVDFAASMAIRMFITLTRAMKRNGRTMVLYGAQPLVGEIFVHAALAELMPIVADQAQALAAAASG